MTSADRSAQLRAALARFPASLFQSDQRIREGWLSDRYFLRTAATLAFARYVRECEADVGGVSLVDYRNDSVADSLAVARAMRREFGDGVLTGVRVDTSERLIDRSLAGEEAKYAGEPPASR